MNKDINVVAVVFFSQMAMNELMYLVRVAVSLTIIKLSIPEESK